MDEKISVTLNSDPKMRILLVSLLFVVFIVRIKAHTATAVCCDVTSIDVARGWRPACIRSVPVTVRYYCGYRIWCTRIVYRNTTFCCNSFIRNGSICLIPKNTTTTVTTAAPITVTGDVTTAASTQKCGLSKYSDAGGNSLSQIVGGQQARPNEFPWQVSLRKYSWAGSNHFCGGSIISNRLIVTAAHCAVYLSTSSNYPQYVVVGDHDRSITPSGGVYQISQYFVHPGYTGNPINNDIAIVVVSRNITFSDNVQPICLPTGTTNSYDGKTAVVSGWGKTQLNGDTSKILMYARLNIMSIIACRAIAPFWNLPIDQLCATDNSGFVQRDSCQGDSGGPLAVKTGTGIFELVGIVSWGYGCASGYPGIYARVTEFVAWINAYLSQF